VTLEIQLHPDPVPPHSLVIWIFIPTFPNLELSNKLPKYFSQTLQTIFSPSLYFPSYKKGHSRSSRYWQTFLLSFWKLSSEFLLEIPPSGFWGAFIRWNSVAKWKNSRNCGESRNGFDRFGMGRWEKFSLGVHQHTGWMDAWRQHVLSGWRTKCWSF